MERSPERLSMHMLERHFDRMERAMRMLQAQGRSRKLAAKIIRRYRLDNVLMTDLAHKIVFADALRSLEFRMSGLGRDEEGKFRSKRHEVC